MNMNEIVDQIASKAGISKDQAQTAFTTTVNFIKDKLPDSIGSQLAGLTHGKDINLKEGANMIKDKFF